MIAYFKTSYGPVSVTISHLIKNSAGLFTAVCIVNNSRTSDYYMGQQISVNPTYLYKSIVDTGTKFKYYGIPDYTTVNIVPENHVEFKF
jgi:hypothetical protein